MSIAAFFVFMETHGAIILALWLVFEQWVAANDKLKANSTLQVVVNFGKKFLGKYAKK